MLSDLAIIGASALAVYFTWDVFPLNLLVICFIVMAYKSWDRTGGFIAWDPKVSREFLRRMKEKGL